MTRAAHRSCAACCMALAGRQAGILDLLQTYMASMLSTSASNCSDLDAVALAAPALRWARNVTKCSLSKTSNIN